MPIVHCGRRLRTVVAVSLAASSLTAVALGGRAASPDCQTRLKDTKSSLEYVDGLLAKKVVIFNPSPGKAGIFVVTVQQYTQFLTLQYVSGKLSDSEFASSLATVALRAVQARKYLTTVKDYVTEELSKLEHECGAASPTPTVASPTPSAGGDLKLTITFQGMSETRDEKTDALTPQQTVTADVKSGSSYGGSVKVAGPFPAGDAVYVVFGPTILAVLGPNGGSFSGVSEPTGFGADTSLGAFVCKPGASAGQSVSALSGCLAEGDDLNVQWQV